MDVLRFPQFAINSWVRTCQECMRPQVTKSPKDYKGETWRDLKCKNCKSEPLDYGQVNHVIGTDDDD